MIIMMLLLGILVGGSTAFLYYSPDVERLRCEITELASHLKTLNVEVGRVRKINGDLQKSNYDKNVFLHRMINDAYRLKSWSENPAFATRFESMQKDADSLLENRI